MKTVVLCHLKCYQLHLLQMTTLITSSNLLKHTNILVPQKFHLIAITSVFKLSSSY